MAEKMKIEYVPIDAVVPYVHNAKEHTEQQIANIAKSIEKYGWQQPVLLDKNNEIIAGHGRVLAAKKLGVETIPCIYASELTEQQVREYRILDNKLNESAWLDGALAIELPELNFEDFQLDFGFADEKPEIKEIELKPYNFAHYLITVDVNHHDKIVDTIDKLKQVEGVEVESSLN